MYLRQCYRAKDSKRHACWALVQSVHTAKRPRKNVVAYLGDLDEAGRLGVRQVAATRGYDQAQADRHDDEKALRLGRSHLGDGPGHGVGGQHRVAQGRWPPVHHGDTQDSIANILKNLIAFDLNTIHESLEVKLFPDPDGVAETFILRRSASRREKEMAMHEEFEKSIKEGLNALAKVAEKLAMALPLYKEPISFARTRLVRYSYGSIRWHTITASGHL